MLCFTYFCLQINQKGKNTKDKSEDNDSSSDQNAANERAGPSRFKKRVIIVCDTIVKIK